MNKIEPDKKHIEQLRKFLDLEVSFSENNKFSLLIKGREGSGKTSLISTAPRPILIDHFDTSGTMSIRKPIEEAKGDILIRRWYDYDNGYQQWTDQFNKDLKSGFFQLFTTYAWDSGTSLIDLMSNEVIKRDPKSPVSGLGGKMINVSMYQGMYRTLMEHVALCQHEVQIFIVSFHTKIVEDALTNEVSYELATFPYLQEKLPRQFSEKWTMLAEPNGEHKVLMQRFGRERSSTQIGRDVFDRKEEPDLTALLKKAGVEINPKPSLREQLA